MASTAELNAGFDALHKDLTVIVSTLVPGFFQGTAMQHVESAEGRQLILKAVKNVLEAAEKIRAAK